jgi:hypothetical protein
MEVNGMKNFIDVKAFAQAAGLTALIIAVVNTIFG